jgi:hypothetical protein
MKDTKVIQNMPGTARVDHSVERNTRPARLQRRGDEGQRLGKRIQSRGVSRAKVSVFAVAGSHKGGVIGLETRI